MPLTPGGPQEADPVGWEKSSGLDMTVPLTFRGCGQSGSREERGGQVFDVWKPGL